MKATSASTAARSLPKQLPSQSLATASKFMPSRDGTIPKTAVNRQLVSYASQHGLVYKFAPSSEIKSGHHRDFFIANMRDPNAPVPMQGVEYTDVPASLSDAKLQLELIPKIRNIVKKFVLRVMPDDKLKDYKDQCLYQLRLPANVSERRRAAIGNELENELIRFRSLASRDISNQALDCVLTFLDRNAYIKGGDSSNQLGRAIRQDLRTLKSKIIEAEIDLMNASNQSHRVRSDDPVFVIKQKLDECIINELADRFPDIARYVARVVEDSHSA